VWASLCPPTLSFLRPRGLGILYPLDFGAGIGGLRAGVGVGGALRVEVKLRCPTVLYCPKYTRERVEVEACFGKNFGLGWVGWGSQQQQASGSRVVQPRKVLSVLVQVQSLEPCKS